MVFHLAAGTGEKSFPDAFMNSVVTTRNLLDVLVQGRQLRRFVLVSSFSVYSNRRKPHWGTWTNHARSKNMLELCGEAYGLCYFWERDSGWSNGQLPPAFNRKRWHAYWKKTRHRITVALINKFKVSVILATLDVRHRRLLAFLVELAHVLFVHARRYTCCNSELYLN